MHLIIDQLSLEGVWSIIESSSLIIRKFWDVHLHIYIHVNHNYNQNNWASKASPTLGCSIEISRDIYICCRYVYRMSN